MNREQAQERIDELKGFYSHLASFIGVNLFLFVINMTTSPGHWWFVYPLGGWGIGMFCHAFSVFFNDAKWEDQKMQELTGWTTTQDELDRLAERTDTLVRILSSVDWKAIDPDLLQSKENLLKAQERMAGSAANDESKEEVIRELEKLEAFVTSSKFDYYDKAAAGDRKDQR